MIRIPEIQSSEGSADHAVLTSSINGFYSCQVSSHTATSDTALKALASDAASAAAAEQNAMFSPRLAPDASVRLTDGKGNTVQFSGFVTAPSHRMGVGGVGNSHTVVHESALLSAFAPYIYTAEVERRDDINPLGPDLASRAKTMLEALTKAWQGEGRDRGLDVYEAIKDSIHANNQAVLPKVQKLLTDSAETTKIEGLDRIASHAGLNLGVNSAILKTLISARADFFMNLLNMCAQWQLIYQPSMEAGGVGRILRLQDAIAKGSERSIAVKDFVISGGPMSIIPITGVLVEGLPSSERRASGSPDDVTKFGITPASVVFYGSASGRVATAPLPPFLQRPLHTMFLTDGVDLSLSAYEQSQQEQASDLDDIASGPVRKLAEQWARNHYTDLVLAPSNATLTCELDLGWETGKSYQVKAKSAETGGAVLFQGLLNTQEHIISTRGGSPTAESTLSFSHVLILDNTLPGA